MVGERTDGSRLLSRSGPLLNRSAEATFLCYHSVAEPGPPFLSVAPRTFESHLALLARRGYASGDLAALDRLARGGGTLGARHVFLTFDDGFVDGATTVLPLLKRYGFTGFFFVVPPAVDTGGPLDWPEVAANQQRFPDVLRSMTWDDVERLAEHGCEIGSHTLSHPHLPRLGDEELQQELVDSRRRIAERLGRCDTLAYPFGEWDARVAGAAAAAGYRFAFTLPFGPQRMASALAIPRVTIDHRDDARRLAIKISRPGRLLLLASPARTVAHRIRPPRKRTG